jgi:hypothetical protein
MREATESSVYHVVISPAKLGGWKPSAAWSSRLGQRTGFGVGNVCDSDLRALPDLAREIGAVLGVDHHLSAPLEEEAGRYTGRLTAAPTIGAGKVQAVERFLGAHVDCLARCYAYADDESDIPLLSCVGSPHVVATSSAALLARATREGWTCLAPAESNEAGRSEQAHV